jgi:Xaa-Pro aminopeptidase
MANLPKGKRKYTMPCLHLHNYAKAILKPGLTLKEYTDMVGDEATKHLLELVC